ncbi:glycoside hydrolase TIM-barrel-like domain-containing protein [Paracoccus sp. (in: a-proteobacteria)]|uniref:baseplate multidomain protein megatron n=1 Tax=Paracoccus sp. TaxID=267 RepID=UPI0032205CDC
MATILLGAVGTAIGGGFGGTILGLSGAAIGGMIGSGIGSMVDSWIVSSLLPGQRIEGQRMDSLRITSATEGVVIPRLYGRMRIGGNIIWATDFREETNVHRQGGGKGGGQKVTTTEYLYYASFAVALCEGTITGIGRIWADGEIVDLSEATWRWYPGSEAQAPDPFIAAKMGVGNTPAYRGTAYVVFEELPLARFGNRLPQLSFEVFRPLDDADTAEGLVPAVTVIPASGEWSYATQIVRKAGDGDSAAENVNAMAGTADMVVSLDRLEAMVPKVESASLVVSWFGDDLRAGSCTIRPKVEMAQKNTTPAWSVNGVSRGDALVVSQDDQGRPIYGGTPADFSVLQAIREMRARGLKVTFYPFLMMDVPAGNTLPDPWSDYAAAIGQSVLPWRGRITCSPAAGFAGTVDKTAAAAVQVDAFFGNAQPSDFAVSGDSVTWTGGADWGFRRMILHYAHLCAVAGGVDAFLIGSEMRGLTSIRSGASTYPAVAALQSLAAAVRSILGPGTKISYAADWSEYFGHHPGDGSGDVFFHLDPLWADDNVDFIGIDNYMPLSDWRDGWEHLDALAWPSIYDRAYLQSNIAGGEGFDWYYASEGDRIAQNRTPIEDSITPGAGGKVITAMPVAAPGISQSPGTSFTTTVPYRSASITLSCRVQFPALIADGIVFEIGNLSSGMFFGLAGGQLILHEIFSAIGQTRTASTPAASLAGRTADLVAWFDMASGEIGFAVDGNVAATASFGGSVSGTWAANNGAGYGLANGPVSGSSTVTTALPWPGALVSNLSIWSGAVPSFATLPAVAPEPWIFRYKDIRGWWSNPHRNRPGGIPAASPTAWLPQSKPIRFTELGCPAVDRGPNQPNVFHDPKSSESFVPWFSRGWRDDAVQRAYLEATYLFWGDAANNPVSTGYAGHMVEVAECAAWTWDARPYPFFPQLGDIWADGDNWRLGHWLTGRLGAVSLAALVRDLCLRAGMPSAWIDVSGLTGAADGYVISALESPRTSITMLARHFGFDAVESEGRIRFVMRGRAPVATVALDGMAAGRSDVMELARGQETELPQALKWQVARADEDYDGITVESRRIAVSASRVSSDSFPMAVPPEEADRRCRRALMEAWIGRETGAFSLPPSRLALDPGDVLLLDHDGRLAEMRILSVADGDARGVEAIRQDRMAYDLPPGSPRAASLARPVVFGPPLALFMDLPQLREDHSPHQPLIAAHARPWPGQMAVFRSPEDSGFDLLTTFSGRARMGELVADLYAGPTARFDYGNSVYVDLLSGTLESVTDLRLFGGENTIAVEQPTGDWEILQFSQAKLIAPGRYRLSRLLRGQRGTDVGMAAMVSAGARVVVLDTALAELPVAEADLGLPWNWRIGPASRPVSDDSFAALAFTPRGIGLRPFAPVHVEQPWRRARVPGDLTISWVRRDRSLAADSWNAAEVPMTEASEAWQVEILDGATVKRFLTTVTASVVYTAAQQTADWGAPLAPGASLDIRIAQIGQAFGAGAAPVTTLWF